MNMKSNALHERERIKDADSGKENSLKTPTVPHPQSSIFLSESGFNQYLLLRSS